MLPTPNFAPGELAEWSNAAVLKTVDCNRSGGSNPSLSALNIENQYIIQLGSKKGSKLAAFFRF